jgi:hypothetical protein
MGGDNFLGAMEKIRQILPKENNEFGSIRTYLRWEKDLYFTESMRWVEEARVFAPRMMSDYLHETYFLFMRRIVTGDQYGKIAAEFGVDWQWMRRACDWWRGFLAERMTPFEARE